MEVTKSNKTSFYRRAFLHMFLNRDGLPYDFADDVADQNAALFSELAANEYTEEDTQHLVVLARAALAPCFNYSGVIYSAECMAERHLLGGEVHYLPAKGGDAPSARITYRNGGTLVWTLALDYTQALLTLVEDQE